MLTKLIKGLKDNGFQVTYGQWGQGKAPKLPYLVIIETDDVSFFADDSRFYKIRAYDVEFYFERKDPNFEEKLESFFDENDIPFSKGADAYIPEERFFEKVYSIEIGERKNG